MIICLVVAGLFALIAGLSTWAVVRLQRAEIARSATELERYKTEAGERIADATKDAGRANERAAELEQETERLKAANLALEATIAPRRITDGQRKALVESLKKFGGRKVLVSSYSLDAEGMLLGHTIIKILQDAGIVVSGLTTVVPITTLRAGIHVTAVTDAGQPLAHGMADSIGQNTSLTVTYNPKIPAGEAQIELGGSGDVAAFEAILLVGVKPPPK